LIFALALGLITALAAGDSSAKEFSFEYQRILETGPTAELELHFISGDLTIGPTDGERVIIEAVKRVDAVNMDEAQLAADHIEIKVDHSDRKVRVNTNYLRMRNRGQSFWNKVLGTGGEDSFGEVDWHIQVPPDCKIQIVSTGGKVDISHVMGDISIRSSAADIRLNSIEGKIEIDNAGGSMTGELLFGPMIIQQAQGKIDLQFVEGDLRVKSATADISIRQDRGALDLTTISGNVEIQTNLDSSRDYFVRTESGHIVLTIPETSSADLRIESQTGNIRTDMPIAISSMSHRQIKGRFGVGGVDITLTSITGDVTVAQF
jgi:hypothetical protein